MRKWIDLFENAAFAMPIAEILLDARSMKLAIKDILNNKVSFTNGPVSLFSEGDGLRLGDGYHRVVQAVLLDHTEVRAKIDSKYATDFSIADANLWRAEDGLGSLGFSEDEIERAKDIAIKAQMTNQ